MVKPMFRSCFLCQLRLQTWNASRILLLILRHSLGVNFASWAKAKMPLIDLEQQQIEKEDHQKYSLITSFSILRGERVLLQKLGRPY